MSLMAMKRFVEKFGVVVVALLALPLLIGIVYSGIGRNLGPSGGSRNAGSGEKPVAKVGDLEIPRSRLDAEIARSSSSGGSPPPTPELMDMYRLMLLEQFRSQQAVVAAGKQAGITLGDADLADAREKAWNEQVKPGIVSQLQLPATASDSEIEAALKKVNPDLTLDIFKQQSVDPERLKIGLTYDRLKAKAAEGIKVDEALVKRSYNDIQVRHILIKSGEGALPDDQAKAKAEKLLAAVLKDPAKMPELAKANSEDPGSKAKGGFYDWQSAQGYVPEFTEAALAAGVGKINPGLVKTSFGYHIIKLEGERPGKTLPKDWDKEKQKYIQQYVDRIAGGKAGDLVKAAEPTVTTELLDPGLRAAKLVRDAGGSQRDAKLAEAIAELDKVPPADDPLGAVPLRKAAIFETLGKPKEAVLAYEAALKGRNLPETRFKLADAYAKSGDTAKVKEQIVEIEKLALTSPDQWKQLADLYRKIGDKAGERKALEKNQEMVKRQMDLLKQQMSRMQPPPGAPKPPAGAKPGAK